MPSTASGFINESFTTKSHNTTSKTPILTCDVCKTTQTQANSTVTCPCKTCLTTNDHPVQFCTRCYYFKHSKYAPRMNPRVIWKNIIVATEDD